MSKVDILAKILGFSLCFSLDPSFMGLQRVKRLR